MRQSPLLRYYLPVRTVVLLLFVTGWCVIQAQPASFYVNSAFGRQELSLDTSKIVVAFSPGLTPQERAAFVQKEPALKPYLPSLEFPQFGATVLALQPGMSGKSVWTLLTALNSQTQLIYAAPFLQYRDGALQGVLNEINVGLKHAADLAWLQSACKEYGLETPVQNEFDSLMYSVRVSDNRMGRALDVANALHESGKPAYAEVNFLMIIKKHTNDPIQIAQWAQDNDAHYWDGFEWIDAGDVDADMDVEPAWNITTGSASIKVAVIDEGVDLDHPDLIGNMLGGYDATGFGSGGNPSGDDAHGTACAGIIAAVANNNIGLAGNAYSCKIIPVRIAYTPAGEDDWFTTTTWQANAINWSWQTGGASVLSNSWGGGSPSSAVSTAITNAVTNGRSGKGSPVLFSSGNDDETPVSYPAYYSNVIAVGATSMCDERKSPVSCDGETGWGSNYGTGLDIVAPGVKIATTDIAGSAGYKSGDYTYTFNGTSSSCPNAAGVMAMILSVNPNLTQTQARAILEQTCDKTGDYTYNTNGSQPNGTWSDEMGYGRVNALAACIQATGYCPGFGNSTDDEWIASIQIGTFSKISGDNLGYGFYTNLSTQLAQGNSYPVTLTPGYSGSEFDEYWRIWIDFNKDGDYNDSGELVFDSGAANAGTTTGTLTVPANAATGATRMRIAMSYDESTEPCEQFYFGEVEEYGVVVNTGSGSNNGCDQATVISCGGTVTGTTSGVAQNVAICGTELNTAPGRWYRYTASQSGIVTVSTCSPNTDFDTKIGVFSGTCSNLTCVDGNDDDDGCTEDDVLSTVQFSATSGQTYYIYVTGYDTNTGTFQLSLSCGSSCQIPTGFAATETGYAHVLLGWNSVAGATGYQTRQRVVSGQWVEGSVFATPGVFWGNLVPNSQYEFQVRAQCSATVYSDWSASIFVTTLGAGDPYCYSYGLTWDDWIAGVSFSNLNNATGKNYGYGSFTNLTANVQQGNAYNITLTPATDDNSETVYWRVWIDFNKDNDFSDTGEQVFQTTGSNSSPVTGSISIPAGAGTGTTRMRVSMSLSAYATPCQVNEYREVEDYAVNITSGAQAPVSNFSASTTCGQFPLTVQFTDVSTNNPSSWQWNFGNGQTSNQQNPGYTYTQAGIYTVSLTTTNAGGTDIEEKIAFITVVAPVTLNAIPGTESCTGSPVLLQANGATQYAWTGTGLNNSTGVQVSALPVAPGTYNYTVVGSTNNCAANPTSITLTFHPLPTINLAASSNSACIGESVSLTATGASGYSWSGTGLSANSGATVSAMPGVPGSYTYQVTGTSNGCTSAPQSVIVQFNTVPVVSLNASSTSTCAGQSVTLTASGATGYSWSGTGLSSNSGTSVNAMPGLPGSYTYQVTGTTNGCTSIPQSVNIQFNNVPVVNLNASTASICAGQSVTLTASGASTYQWSGTGLSANTGNPVTAVPPAAGNYTYTVTGNTNGCTSTPQSVEIQVNPAPVVTVTADNGLICLGDTVTLTATGATQYFWNGPGLITFNGASVKAVPTQTGALTYTVSGFLPGCDPTTINIPVTVANNLLSVGIAVEDCPGPNLTFTANVANGGGSSNILWYRNGVAVWNGSTYTLFAAVNGDAVYCEVTPVNPPPCTQPAVAQSGTVVVDCIPLGTNNIAGLEAATIMPNPNNGDFRLQLELTQPLQGDILIFNALGQLMNTQQAMLPQGSHTIPVSLPAPAPGFYWLLLQAEGRLHRIGFEVQ